MSIGKSNRNKRLDREQVSLLNNLGSVPVRDNEPVFQEPWEAEVFAMTLLLHEQGLFSWQQWADQLSSSIKQAQLCGDPDDGSTYYQHWLTALEDLIVKCKIGDRAQLESLFKAWDSAARSTPHGQAIELKSS